MASIPSCTASLRIALYVDLHQKIAIAQFFVHRTAPFCGFNRSKQHMHRTFQQGFDNPEFCVVVDGALWQ